MTVYRLADHAPHLAAGAYVAPTAAVIGRVELHENASVWFGATLRGDNELISIGPSSNVQDGAVLHTDPGFPLTLAARVSVGHQAMLHGCSVGEGALIGIQAVILNGAVIGPGCLVGAGAVVTEGKNFPEGTLILGAPAVVKRQLSPQERDNLLKIAENYAARAAHYQASLKSL
jgi:carbonic anhydrase/acetyltransferase-like protein (isoleucine patch superfamily)